MVWFHFHGSFESHFDAAAGSVSHFFVRTRRGNPCKHFQVSKPEVGRGQYLNIAHCAWIKPLYEKYPDYYNV